MTTLTERFSQAAEAFQGALQEAEPLAKGYFDFLCSGQTNQYTNDYVPLNHELKFEDFEVSATETSEGITYIGQDLDYGDVYDYKFTVPFAYLEDPENWKHHLFAELRDMEAQAEKAFLTAYPDMEEALEAGRFEIKLDLRYWTPGEDLFSMVIAKAGTKGSMFIYHSNIQESHIFMISRDTGAIYSTPHFYSDIERIKAGEIKPLTEQR